MNAVDTIKTCNDEQICESLMEELENLSDVECEI